MSASGKPWALVTFPSIQPLVSAPEIALMDVAAYDCPGGTKTKWPKSNKSKNPRILPDNPRLVRTMDNTRLMDAPAYRKIQSRGSGKATQEPTLCGRSGHREIQRLKVRYCAPRGRKSIIK